MPDTVVKCPHCNKPVIWADSSRYKPFCSERCKLVDLGDWLLERNAIPGTPAVQQAVATEEHEDG